MSIQRRWLYLPGLGTGWRSAKGQALAARLGRYQIALQCVDLRVPEFRTMRVSAMLKRAKEGLGSGSQSAVVIGTSLGGFVAAQLAASDPRVEALVLYAPRSRSWRASAPTLQSGMAVGTARLVAGVGQDGTPSADS